MSLIPNPWRNYGPIRRREARAGLLFVLPWLLGLLIFNAYPVLASVYYSFTDYSVTQAPNFVGLDNYKTMFLSDPSIYKAVGNSLYYALLSVPLGLLLSLGLAVLLNTRSVGIGVYRTLFYLPSLVPPVVSTIIFLILFQSRNGLVNVLLGSVGLPNPAWFQDPHWAKPGLILLSLWGVGASTIIFLAGLQEVPTSLLDAAAIDGADAWQKFRHVSLPLLTPVILFNLVMGIIYSFQVFSQALVVGGPTGNPVESTLMFMVLIYNNAFRYFKMGYASAQAVVLFVVVLVVTLVIFRTARVWVFSETDERAT